MIADDRRTFCDRLRLYGNQPLYSVGQSMEITRGTLLITIVIVVIEITKRKCLRLILIMIISKFLAQDNDFPAF